MNIPSLRVVEGGGSIRCHSKSIFSLSIFIRAQISERTMHFCDPNIQNSRKENCMSFQKPGNSDLWASSHYNPLELLLKYLWCTHRKSSLVVCKFRRLYKLSNILTQLMNDSDSNWYSLKDWSLIGRCFHPVISSWKIEAAIKKAFRTVFLAILSLFYARALVRSGEKRESVLRNVNESLIGELVLITVIHHPFSPRQVWTRTFFVNEW